jgi:hypothetical protein
MQKTEANKISIPLRGNDELAAVLTGCNTGDKIELKKVIVIIDEATQELITGTIDEIGAAEIMEHGADLEDPAEKERAKRAPVMSVMGSFNSDLDRDTAESRDAFSP